VRESALDIYLQDLNNDEIPEVIVRSLEHPVNDCVQVFSYRATSKSLEEIEFQARNLCNVVKTDSHLVSRYRSGAKWIEDIYAIENNGFSLLFTDSCIGCGWISRKEYRAGGYSDQYLVANVENFSGRSFFLAKISNASTEVISALDGRSTLVGKLKKGDEVKILEVMEKNGMIFVRVENHPHKIKGWIMCDEIDKCDAL